VRYCLFLEVVLLCFVTFSTRSLRTELRSLESGCTFPSKLEVAVIYKPLGLNYISSNRAWSRAVILNIFSEDATLLLEAVFTSCLPSI